MIKIIKEGSSYVMHKTKRFHCNNCDCIFETDDASYIVEKPNFIDSYIKITCPYCGELLYKSLED